MFFYLSKLFTLFLMPFFWLFLCLFLAIILNNKVWKKRFLISSFVILFIFGNEHLALWATRKWEVKALAMNQIGNYKVGVVLGGGITNEFRKPYDRVHFNASADRLLQAIQLYKKGKIENILITGRNGLADVKGPRAGAKLAKTFCVEMGVPETHVFDENLAVNTYENATYTKQYLAKKGIQNDSLLVITSSYHIPRSMMCFNAAGLKSKAFPCDHKGGFSYSSLAYIIPDEYAFFLWYDLFHEWFGIVTYKIMGYI